MLSSAHTSAFCLNYSAVDPFQGIFQPVTALFISVCFALLVPTSLLYVSCTFWSCCCFFLKILDRLSLSLWILFQVDCLSHLVVPLTLYLIPSSGTYFCCLFLSDFLFDCDFHSAGCRTVVFLAFAVYLCGWSCLRGLVPTKRDWFLPAFDEWSWSLSSDGQARVKCCVYRQLCAWQDLPGSSVRWVGCAHAQSAVWPEGSQHWRLQLLCVLMRKCGL